VQSLSSVHLEVAPDRMENNHQFRESALTPTVAGFPWHERCDVSGHRGTAPLASPGLPSCPRPRLSLSAQFGQRAAQVKAQARFVSSHFPSVTFCWMADVDRRLG
jgi:hypothetical protein